jgi:hypothetical protein
VLVVSAGGGLTCAGANGAFGAAVEDRLGRTYALTCAHVVTPPWAHAPWSPVEIPAPGVAASTTIGTVADWTRFDRGSANTADAALVALPADVSASNAALRLRDTAIPNLTIDDMNARSGEQVTIVAPRGPIQAVIGSVVDDQAIDFLGYEFLFSNIVQCRAETKPGDSGSAVVDAAGHFVGLHFAGEGLVGYFVMSRKILQVFSTYELRLL